MLDAAVLEVAKNPLIGEEKRGDLVGVFVHKFKLQQPNCLLISCNPTKISPSNLF